MQKKHPEIDRQEDDMIVDFMRKNDNIVIESRLAGLMALKHTDNVWST